MSLVLLLMDEYLNHAWNQPTSNHGQSQAISFGELSRNIVIVSSAITGIGAFAHALGKRFDTLLMTVLYPLLLKLGDESAIVSDAALNALQIISCACGYGNDADLTGLITTHADRLADILCLHLRHLETYPDTPRVLEVMCDACWMMMYDV